MQRCASHLFRLCHLSRGSHTKCLVPKVDREKHNGAEVLKFCTILRGSMTDPGPCYCLAPKVLHTRP